jgi:hypothetical protein
MVQQYFVKGIAHSSYLLGVTEACAIADPRCNAMIFFHFQGIYFK